jgi:hypothetical protein
MLEPGYEVILGHSGSVGEQWVGRGTVGRSGHSGSVGVQWVVLSVEQNMKC